MIEREWLSVLFADDRPKGSRFMTLLVGYFDDSGTDAGSSVAAIGGFVAPPIEWLGFNTRWQAVLDKYGIDMHHHNKWSNLARPFDDKDKWPQERRKAYLNELLDVILGRKVVSIGAGVPVQRFREQFSARAQKLTTPFGVAAQCVFAEAAALVKPMVPDARIAYVFASGTQGYSEVQKTFQDSVAIPEVVEEFGLKSLTKASVSQVMQLQAADIVAYEVYKLWREGDENLDPAKVRYPLQQIGNRVKSRWITPSEEMLKKASDSFEEMAVLKAIAVLTRGRGLIN